MNDKRMTKQIRLEIRRPRIHRDLSVIRHALPGVSDPVYNNSYAFPTMGRVTVAARRRPRQVCDYVRTPGQLSQLQRLTSA